MIYTYVTQQQCHDCLELQLVYMTVFFLLSFRERTPSTDSSCTNILFTTLNIQQTSPLLTHTSYIVYNNIVYYIFHTKYNVRTCTCCCCSYQSTTCRRSHTQPTAVGSHTAHAIQHGSISYTNRYIYDYHTHLCLEFQKSFRRRDVVLIFLGFEIDCMLFRFQFSVFVVRVVRTQFTRQRGRMAAKGKETEKRGTTTKIGQIGNINFVWVGRQAGRGGEQETGNNRKTGNQ